MKWHKTEKEKEKEKKMNLKWKKTLTNQYHQEDYYVILSPEEKALLLNFRKRVK